MVMLVTFIAAARSFSKLATDWATVAQCCETLADPFVAMDSAFGTPANEAGTEEVVVVVEEEVWEAMEDVVCEEDVEPVVVEVPFDGAVPFDGTVLFEELDPYMRVNISPMVFW